MSPRRSSPIVLVLSSLVLAVAAAGAEEVDLSPSAWSEGERDLRFAENAVFGGPNRPATGPGVVVGTTGPPAIRAGIEALRRGGSAVDAALTTALAQVALAGGAWVSYAGILTLVVYDAETGEVLALDAAYDTVRGEDDPASIPPGSSAGASDPEPSGRTALVPGFMAGVEAAHARFGRLPFRALFTPAIAFAEDGFRLTALHGGMLARREPVLRRLEATRAVFEKEDGSFVGEGDLFRQPALAATLRRVADEGAAYLYTGEWAERFVAAVRADGGRMSLDDLAAYRPRWSAAMRVTYRGHEVCAPALPAQGGVSLAEALRIAERADVAGRGPITSSAEAFHWLHQASSLFVLNHVAPEVGAAMIGGADASPAARATEEHAERLWRRIEEGRCLLARPPAEDDSKHSDGIVAVDARGNVAAVVHSINTSAWGDTGLFVDGVSIPDSASFQQDLVARTGPGRRLPNPTEPLIVLADGVPVAALASIGGGLHQATVGALVNLVGHGLAIDEVLGAPTPHLPSFSALGGARPRVFEGDFEDALLERVGELGLDVEVLSAAEGGSVRGYVVGASVDRAAGTATAIGTKILNGRAMATD
ncbi:MAG: gamma-glutamyltransferase [Planctomycetota bacterium JB042]